MERFAIAPQVGVEMSVQPVRAVNRLSSGPSFERREVAATFVALQSHVRMRLDDFMEASFAAGPAVAVGDADRCYASPPTTAQGALALAAALRAHIARLYTLELRASNTYLLGRDESFPATNRNHLSYSVGMAFEFKR